MAPTARRAQVLGLGAQGGPRPHWSEERRGCDLGLRPWGRERRPGRITARPERRAPSAARMWKALTYFVALPGVGVSMLNVFLKSHHGEEERPEFVAYPHLRIRSKVPLAVSSSVSSLFIPNALVQVLHSLKAWVPCVYSFSFNPPKHIFIFSGHISLFFFKVVQ